LREPDHKLACFDHERGHTVKIPLPTPAASPSRDRVQPISRRDSPCSAPDRLKGAPRMPMVDT
jgi:hypothetical protein